MKKITFFAIAAVTFLACNNSGQSDVEVSLTNNIDSVSYAIGSSQAKGILGQVPELNVDAFIKGYRDAADSAVLLIADADAQMLLQAFGQKKQQEQLAKQRKENEANYADVMQSGIDFLEENKTKPGVKITESGLQYIVIKEGSGKKPSATSNVTVHYHGTTPDGTVFDSSVDRGKSIDFGLNQVIRGWTEGLQLMQEGAKYKFFIPQELAYGANAPQGGKGPIKPFMPLVFEVELIKVNS